ncbi:MAG: hypothetical protein NT098_00030 [Candidatus Parcubacteria bacterium]|nr:hypothetical protein [Candidatus Parcubacteria bacterium]
MPKYILEVTHEEQIGHHERYTSYERLEFERDSDSSAVRYAFSSAGINAEAEYKKLFSVIEPYGSTKRIYPEEE